LQRQRGLQRHVPLQWQVRLHVHFLLRLQVLRLRVLRLWRRPPCATPCISPADGIGAPAVVAHSITRSDGCGLALTVRYEMGAGERGTIAPPYLRLVRRRLQLLRLRLLLRRD